MKGSSYFLGAGIPENIYGTKCEKKISNFQKPTYHPGGWKPPNHEGGNLQTMTPSIQKTPFQSDIKVRLSKSSQSWYL